ncbi:MAG: FAD-binding oxidoreductase [Candidatus Geothermincolia bacterium]
MLKDLGNSIFDVASIGLVVARKAYARSLADERDIDPGLVARTVDALHPHRVPVAVAEIIEETPTTSTLRLVPSGDQSLFPYRAGQFATLFLTVEGVRTSRAYSISSPPTRLGSLDITVRKMPEGFVSKHLVENVAVGDSFEISGPGGFFYHEPLVDTNDLVFLAGGSGITPFMSMIRGALDLKSDLNILVLYGSRTADDVIFWDELTEIACREDNISATLILSEPPAGHEGPCGLLDAEVIDGQVGEIAGKTFYMCGPQAMYGLCGPALESLGVPTRRIKKEASGPPPDITLTEGWPGKVKPDEMFTVRIADTHKLLDVVAGEPLLNSLERHGIALDNLCRSGECGVCRAALVDGSVFMPEAVAVRQTDLAYGYIHPCMSYPISDITIRL